jgi:uncharacterized protein (DUF58 family)
MISDRLSNGDDNEVRLEIENLYPIKMSLEVIDEIPHQFQKRDFLKTLLLESGERKEFAYYLRPVARGVYSFGSVNVYAVGAFRLFKRKFVFDANREVAVYPAYLQLRKYELMAVSRDLFESGAKRMKRIGHSYEFDRIRKYVPGDDYRDINWKATARNGSLMANQYTDERAQHVYSVVDMGRAMKMPFEGMTLLDYAINASLALSAVALKKHDKPGLLAFNNEISIFTKADHKKAQLQRINDGLYAQTTNFLEPNYPLLCSFIFANIKQRSLIVLYTNFETLSGLHRRLDYFKRIAKKHLLVVIFFKNTELNEIVSSPAKKDIEVYTKITAEKMLFEKRRIVKELSKHGITAIYTDPKDLTAETINKYLEIKSKCLV